jgi:hypothetical protein
MRSIESVIRDLKRVHSKVVLNTLDTRQSLKIIVI